MKLKEVKDVDVNNKRVFLRVDFNVSVKDGKIEDGFRIEKTLPTINYLLDNNAKLIIAGHLGRPKGKKDKSLSMKILADKLKEYLKKDVKFFPDCIGELVKKEVSSLSPGEVLMLENLRFYPGEEEDDDDFAKELASLAEVYINDAFSVSHRKHASVHKIAKYLPSYAGFLMQKEVETLHKVYFDPKKPLVLVMGGAKAPTKVKLVKRFLSIADHILLGGIVSNVILDAKGISIGKSKVSEEIKKCTNGLDLTSPKLHLPIDVVVANDIDNPKKADVVAVGSVDDNHIILDVGPETVKLFSDIVKNAKMVVWNGPLGYYEYEEFAKGTDDFAEALCKSKAYKIVGGGESIAALDKIGDLDKIDFVSTGGGAMLEFLAGEEMPGVEILKA